MELFVLNTPHVTSFSYMKYQLHFPIGNSRSSLRSNFRADDFGMKHDSLEVLHIIVKTESLSICKRKVYLTHQDSTNSLFLHYLHKYHRLFSSWCVMGDGQSDKVTCYDSIFYQSDVPPCRVKFRVRRSGFDGKLAIRAG